MFDIGKHAWLFDLTQTLLRSWWTLVAAVCLGLAGATLALQHLPKKYQATTTIWLSRPQLPESVAPPTVNEDMTRRLIVFRAAVLDQPYMIELINATFGLPETEEGLRNLMTTLRSRVTVENLITSRRQGFATFELTYRGDSDPQRAASVINTLTRLYISQNAEFRSKRAEKTAEALISMTEAVKPKLDEVNRKILRFMEAHRFETQADLAQNHSLLDAALGEVELMRTKRIMLDTRIQSLEVQLTLAEMRSYDPTDTDGPPRKITIGSRTRRLAELQRELDEMRIHYSEVHPTYRKKKREFEELLAAARAPELAVEEEAQDSGTQVDPALALLQFQLDRTNVEMVALDGEAERLGKNIAEFQLRIANTPAVEIQLNELTERQAYLRGRHSRLRSQAEAAGGAVDLEEEELLGSRMVVLDFASVPVSPYSPQPLRLYAVGVAMGFLLFIGPPLARNLLNPVILSEEGFRALSEHPVLVSIPNLPHSHNVAARRLFKNLAFSMASGAVLVATKVFLVS